MFQPNYYYDNNMYYADILLLGEVTIDTFENKSLEALVQLYIEFEEDFYGIKFTDEIKQLRLKNVELEFEFKKNKTQDIYNEIIEVNSSLQKQYITIGFEKLRTEIRDNYIYNEMKDLEQYGGEING